MVISMLKIRRPLGRLIFNVGIAIPGKTVFLIETAPWCWPSPEFTRTQHFYSVGIICQKEVGFVFYKCRTNLRRVWWAKWPDMTEIQNTFSTYVSCRWSIVHIRLNYLKRNSVMNRCIICKTLWKKASAFHALINKSIQRHSWSYAIIS